MIILTSNLGVKKLQDFGTGIGFSSNSYGNEEAKKQMLMKEMKNFFAPEFINRIDDTIVFNSLSSEDIKKITKIELDKLMDRVKGMNYTFTYDDKLVDLIHKVGYDETYGARPIKRAIQDRVEDYVSEEILKGTLSEGDSRFIDVVDDQLVLVKPSEPVEEPKKKTRKKKEG